MSLISNVSNVFLNFMILLSLINSSLSS